MSFSKPCRRNTRRNRHTRRAWTSFCPGGTWFGPVPPDPSSLPKLSPFLEQTNNHIEEQILQTKDRLKKQAKEIGSALSPLMSVCEPAEEETHARHTREKRKHKEKEKEKEKDRRDDKHPPRPPAAGTTTVGNTTDTGEAVSSDEEEDSADEDGDHKGGTKPRGKHSSYEDRVRRLASEIENATQTQRNNPVMKAYLKTVSDSAKAPDRIFHNEDEQALALPEHAQAWERQKLCIHGNSGAVGEVDAQDGPPFGLQSLDTAHAYGSETLSTSTDDETGRARPLHPEPRQRTGGKPEGFCRAAEGFHPGLHPTDAGGG